MVAYLCLTGHHPFVTSSEAALYEAMKGARTPATAHRALPDAIDAFFARALSVDPADRFDRIEQLAEAFERGADVVWCGSSRGDGGRSGADHVPTKWRWFRLQSRRRFLLGSGGLSVAAALCAGVVAAVAVAIVDGAETAAGPFPSPTPAATEPVPATPLHPQPRPVTLRVAVPTKAEVTRVLTDILADAREHHAGYRLERVNAHGMVDGFVDLRAKQLTVTMMATGSGTVGHGSLRRCAERHGRRHRPEAIPAGRTRRSTSHDAAPRTRGGRLAMPASRRLRADVVLRHLDAEATRQVWQFLPEGDGFGHAALDRRRHLRPSAPVTGVAQAIFAVMPKPAIRCASPL